MIDFFRNCLHKCSIILKFLILSYIFLSVDLLAEEEFDSSKKDIFSKNIISKEDDPFDIINEDKGGGDMKNNRKKDNIKEVTGEKEERESGSAVNSTTTPTANYDFETSEDDDSESSNSEQNLNSKYKKNSNKATTETDSDSTGIKNPINDEQFSSSRKEHKFALVSCLNKITAKSKEIKIAIGKTEFCGNLEIKVIRCVTVGLRKNIFVNVTEHKLNYDNEKIFGGWLISGSPSISTVTHPVYELFAKSCSDIDD